MINGPPEEEREGKSPYLNVLNELTSILSQLKNCRSINAVCVCARGVWIKITERKFQPRSTHAPSTRLRHTNRKKNVNEPKAVVNIHIVEVPQQSRNQTGDYNLLIENYYSCIDHKMASRHPIIYKKKRGKNVIFSFHSPRTIE